MAEEPSCRAAITGPGISSVEPLEEKKERRKERKKLRGRGPRWSTECGFSSNEYIAGAVAVTVSVHRFKFTGSPASLPTCLFTRVVSTSTRTPRARENRDDPVSLGCSRGYRPNMDEGWRIGFWQKAFMARFVSFIVASQIFQKRNCTLSAQRMSNTPECVFQIFTDNFQIKKQRAFTRSRTPRRRPPSQGHAYCCSLACVKTIANLFFDKNLESFGGIWNDRHLCRPNVIS